MSRAFLIILLALSCLCTHAAREVFQRPLLGGHVAMWRLTNDPAIRHEANYHNTERWSPDGRYVCATYWGIKDDSYGGKSGASIHVHDLHKDEDRQVGMGIGPRPAKRHNWLFYSRFNPGAGASWEKGTEVMRVDLDTGEQRHWAWGVEEVSDVDAEDRWVIGARRYRGQTPEHHLVRLSATEPDVVEELTEAVGAQRLCNPRYPRFFTREDHRDEPFGATRWFFDLDGRNKRLAVPTVQQCHMAWLGNGEYFLLGNGLIRGRKWNEPFPSNLHILASVSVGDVSPCGRSGRYVCGDDVVADLRSGDGWVYNRRVSVICWPKDVADDSGIYDSDPHGSPDGTKVCFASNYDLKDGPVTFVTRAPNRGEDLIPVQSTETFPATGRLVIGREVIGHRSKTPTAFEGLTRGMHDTATVGVGAGQAVTSFEARLIPQEIWKKLPGPSSAMRASCKDPNSPLLQQRQTDLYVAVVRLPDAPHLRLAGGQVQLIPGEEHAETCGYHVLRNGQRITAKLVPVGGSLDLTQPGDYQAQAVEWSGLEGKLSASLTLTAAAKLTALAEAPPDFSWTSDRWLVGEREVARADALQAAESVREIVHLHDGVIHREWYTSGVIARRHDLNADGKAIRRLTYDKGKLKQREYFTGDGFRVSLELLDAEGFITEWTVFRLMGETVQERSHWWYDRGMPIRMKSAAGGSQEWEKQGNKWVQVGR